MSLVTPTTNAEDDVAPPPPIHALQFLSEEDMLRAPAPIEENNPVEQMALVDQILHQSSQGHHAKAS